MKYLLDTCIWRDFYEDRFGPRGRPLGSYASKLFLSILKRGDEILFSLSITKELSWDAGHIDEFLGFVSALGILRFVETSDAQVGEAVQLSRERRIPFVDCLNAVQSRDEKAVLISQDKHILRDLSDVAETKSPQEII